MTLRELLERLPSCRNCNGPMVVAFDHPKFGTFTARESSECLRCLGCDQPRVAGDSEHDTWTLHRAFSRDELQELGEMWRRQQRDEKAKFRRAMEGRW